MSRNRLASRTVLLIALTLTVVGCGSCSEILSQTKACTVDADCSGNGWCLGEVCQTPYGLTLNISKDASADGKVHASGILSMSVTVTGGTPPVEIGLVDGTRLQGGLVASPYALAWDTKTAPEGSQRIVATAKGGTRVYSSQTVEVVVDNVPPAPPVVTPAVASPTNKGTTRNPLSVAGTAEEKARVSIREAGAEIAGVDVTNGGFWTDNLTNLLEGTHHLEVTTTDLAGNTSPATLLTVVADRTPPTVVSRTPAPGATNVWSRDPITVSFSKPISGPAIDQTAVVTDKAGVPLAKTLALSADGKSLTISPTSPPTVPNTLSVALGISLIDLAGNAVVVPADAWRWDLPEWQAPGSRQALNVAAPSAPRFPSIVIGGSDKPIVAFQEDSLTNGPGIYGGPIRVRRFDGAAWDVAFHPNDLWQAENPSLAIDSQGRLLVAWSEYMQSTTSWRVHVARLEGEFFSGIEDSYEMSGGWAVGSGVNRDRTHSAYSPSLAVDSNDRPIVAWIETKTTPGAYGDPSQIFVARWELGVGWRVLGVDGVSTNWSSSAYRPSLALDDPGILHVAWSEVTTGSMAGQVHVARWIPSSYTWELVGGVLNADPAMNAPEPSLQLDAGMPVVAWMESTTAGCGGYDCPQFRVRVSRWTGMAWQGLGGPLFQDASLNAVYPRIRRKGPGRYVASWAEVDPSKPRYLYVAEWDGTSWGLIGQSVRPAFTGRISNNDIALDSRGVPSIVWEETDGSSASSIYVLRYNK